MSVSIRRTMTIAAAALMALSVAAEPVLAQATVGPAGGVGSTTAPSNSAGTPAGGTGVISTTRVGPNGVTQAPTQNTTPMNGGPAGGPVVGAPAATASTARARRVRHRARPAPRPATQVGTQSQAGTNGAAPTTK